MKQKEDESKFLRDFERNEQNGVRNQIIMEEKKVLKHIAKTVKFRRKRRIDLGA